MDGLQKARAVVACRQLFLVQGGTWESVNKFITSKTNLSVTVVNIRHQDQGGGHYPMTVRGTYHPDRW